jgi:replicative DNA helicase
MTTFLPSNNDAEQGLLSIALQWPETMDAMSEAGGETLFYDPAFRRIWRAMESMRLGKVRIDITTVTATLRADDTLDAIGGPSMLAELASDAPSPAIAPDLLQIARKASKARRIAEIAENASRAILRPNADPDKIAGKMDAALKSVMLDISEDKIKTWPQALGLFLADLQERFKAGAKCSGLSTGFPIMDKMIGGAQPGQLVILGARPSIGKTAFGFQIAENIASNSGPVIFFSAEMEAIELAMRAMSREAKIDSLKFQSAELNKTDFNAIAAATDRQRVKPILVDDRSGIRLADIEIGSRRAVSEHGAKAVFVDYLQLIREDDHSRNREDAVRRLSGGLKQLAKELQIPVFALAQLNRSGEGRDGRPRMSQLRDSGSIEQDANVVILLHRPGFRHDGTAIIEAIIEKARGGKAHQAIEYSFHGPTTTFRELNEINDQ